MDTSDMIWTALTILTVVCVCIDSGFNVFSSIQIIQLIEMFVYIAFPNLPIWTIIYIANLPLEIVSIFSTKKHKIARSIAALYIPLKITIIVFGLRKGFIVHSAEQINHGIILALLVSSVVSFFTIRSSNVRTARTGSKFRSTPKTAASSPQRQLAFVRGLY